MCFPTLQPCSPEHSCGVNPGPTNREGQSHVRVIGQTRIFCYICSILWQSMSLSWLCWLTIFVWWFTSWHAVKENGWLMSPHSPPCGNTLRQPAVPSNSYMTFLVLLKKKSELKPNYYGTLLSLGLGNCSWGGLERVLRAGFRKWLPLRALSNGASANLIMSGKGVNVTQLHVSERLHLISHSLLRALSLAPRSLPVNIYLKAFKLMGLTFAGQQGRTKRKNLLHWKDGRVGKSHIWIEDSKM